MRIHSTKYVHFTPTHAAKFIHECLRANIALVDLADLSTRLRQEIDERGPAARLPETATVSTQGNQVDRLLALIHCLRSVRGRLGGREG